jgi:hypothetical protein
MEPVFRPEIVRIFSGGFLLTSCAFRQKPAISGPDCSAWVIEKKVEFSWSKLYSYICSISPGLGVLVHDECCALAISSFNTLFVSDCHSSYYFSLFTESDILVS